MVRAILTLIYMLPLTFMLAGCPESTGLSGDRDASISLLPVSKTFTLSKDDPKKLQMVIVADPTGSMVETQKAMTEHFPGFTQKLLDTGFVFEIFCSTTSYTGTTFGEIISIKSNNVKSKLELQDALSDCINTPLNELEIGDERGLEAAKITWEKIKANKLLDPNAVKLTLIVTNEDDCSRDLGKFPSDDNVFNRCIDQNVTSSPVEGIKGMGFAMTDNGYADDLGLYPESIRSLTSPIELFPISRYADFFNKNLKYETLGKTDSLDEVLRQRGHIFAPVIMQPPAETGAEANQCADIKTKRAKSIGTSKVMSYGMRYFEVAEKTGNKTYSLCEEIANVFSDINVKVQNEVETKRFVLNRVPKDPTQLQIKLVRKITDVSKADDVLNQMQIENAKTRDEYTWKLEKTTSKKVKNIVVKSQIWTRVLAYGNGFGYKSQTNEIEFDNNLYEAYNDKLQVVSYEPAKLDGDVNYDVNVKTKSN